MSNKFTPGPWFADSRFHTSINNTSKPDEEEHKHIALINFWNTKNEKERIDEIEHKANTSIILAAPDMFEALEAFIEWGTKEKTSWTDFLQVLDKARMAYNKAKGDENV